MRLDKEEVVLFSQYGEKIVDYNQIQYHQASIMELSLNDHEQS